MFTRLLLLLPALALAEVPRDVVSLWDGDPPGAQAEVTELEIVERADPNTIRDRYAVGITDPDLTVFAAPHPAGQAILVIPGGGYQRVVMDKEGFESAEWFMKRGISVFVLRYRLPGESWTNRSDVPLQDAQRALRWIRANAPRFGIRADSIGVMGFSAGGHVAASLATGFDRDVYAARDDVDETSARPDFAVLIYPVISMRAAIAHAGSRERLLGASPDAATIELYSIEANVPLDTPPVFLLHAEDDDVVPVENSLALYESLRAAGIPTELHVYSSGGHGFAMRYALDQPVAEWPELVYRWLATLN